MMKRAGFLILLVGLIGLAVPVEACEVCATLPGGRKTCWSGQPEGWDWCYGGFGRPCDGGGDCRDCTQINCGEPQATTGFCENPITVCGSGIAEVRPVGFVLELPDAVTERPVAVVDAQ